jgi:hypothetical protein
MTTPVHGYLAALLLLLLLPVINAVGSVWPSPLGMSFPDLARESGTNI